MARQTQRSAVTGAARAHRVSGLREWMARGFARLRKAAHDQHAAWHSTLLSRRKLTHPGEVTKMRGPVRVQPRATWYR